MGKKEQFWRRVSQQAVVFGGLVVAVGIGFGMMRGGWAKDVPDQNQHALAHAPSPDQVLKEKINQIVENDQQILQQLEAIMEELRTMKVRASEPRRQPE